MVVNMGVEVMGEKSNVIVGLGGWNCSGLAQAMTIQLVFFFLSNWWHIY